MGSIISNESELNHIVNQLSEKLDNIFRMLLDIKTYYTTGTKKEDVTNITNITINMNEIDTDGFQWDDYEVKNIKNLT
jgi:hypothetical protein